MAVADADLIVIGAGMAGMNAAARAAEAEASVVVIERDRVGGTCPMRGCIPSKALIRSAEVAHEVRTAAGYGDPVGPVERRHGRGRRPRPGDHRQGRERARGRTSSRCRDCAW